MLAWGLPSGVSGACDNTLIPEWRCPVKRPSQDPGEHRANGINVHTSICDLHPIDMMSGGGGWNARMLELATRAMERPPKIQEAIESLRNIGPDGAIQVFSLMSENEKDVCLRWLLQRYPDLDHPGNTIEEKFMEGIMVEASAP